MESYLNSIIYYTNQIKYTYQSILNYFLIFFVIFFLSLHTPFGDFVEFRNSLDTTNINFNIYSFFPFIFSYNTILQYLLPFVFVINLFCFYIIYFISWLRSFLTNKTSENIFVYIHHLISLGFSIILYHYIYKSIIQPISDDIYLIQLYKWQFNIYVNKYMVIILFILLLYFSFQWIQYLMYYVNHLSYPNALSHLMLNILIVELIYKFYALYFYRSMFNINHIYLLYIIFILTIILYVIVLLKSKYKYFYSLDLILYEINKLSLLSSNYFKCKQNLNFKISIFRVPYIYVGSFPLISVLFIMYFMNEIKYYLYVNLISSFIFLICILIFHNILFKSQTFSYKIRKTFLKLSHNNKIGINNGNIYSPETVNIKKINMNYYLECIKRIQCYFSSLNYILFVSCIFILTGIMNIIYTHDNTIPEVIILFRTTEILTNKVSFIFTILINLYIIIRLYIYLKMFSWKTKKIN